MKNNATKHRLCLDCKEIIVGRSDKKFCSDQCRINYHNVKSQKQNKTFRKINSILAKNRSLLKEMSDILMADISKADLLERGYNFKYHTHQLKELGKSVTHCYDYGFYYINPKTLHVVTS